jgi:PIN like domain
MSQTSDPLDALAIGYVLPTEQESVEIWKQASIAVDANVLLNVYRYSPAAREQLLVALTSVQDRLFIPHQAALEYFRNRMAVLTEQLTAKEQMRSGIDDAVNGLLSMLASTHKKLGRRDEPQELLIQAKSKLSTLREELLETEDSWLPTEDPRDDVLHPRVVEVVRGRIGSCYSDERRAELVALSAKRYAAQVPPGYKDADKPAELAAGDLILWMQVLDHAEHTKRPVVLVTDDTKEDWVWEEKGRTIGPRPELVREMHQRAGVSFLLYTPSRFLAYASQDGVAAVDPAVIEEAEAREKARRSPSRSERDRDKPGASSLADLVIRTIDASKIASIDEPQIVPLTRVQSTTPPWNVFLGLGVFPPSIEGRVTCVIAAPTGAAYVWSGSVSPGSPTELSFPGDFKALASPESPVELSAGHYKVLWGVWPRTKSEPDPIAAEDAFELNE